MGLHISTEGQHCRVLQAEQSQDMDEGAPGDSKADDTEAEDGPQDVDISATLQQVLAHNCDLSVAATPTLPSNHSPEHPSNLRPRPPTSPCFYA